MPVVQKPMSGTELVARVLVLEAFVIELARRAGLPADLRDSAMKTVESFHRPDLTVNAEIYADEISKQIGTIDAVAKRV